MEILRQAIGIDISSEKIDVCLSNATKENDIIVVSTGQFQNTKAGFLQLSKWVKQLTKGNDLPMVYLMEATGSYHEELAYYLYNNGSEVNIVLPSKSKKYMQSLNIKSKTDKADAINLARFALERKHDLWQPPKEIYRKLRDLTRERKANIDLRTEAKNRLKSAEAAYDKNAGTIRRIKKDIRHYDSQIRAIDAEIAELIDQDDELKYKFRILTSIKGISGVTAAIVTAETNGFRDIKNYKQLVSYSGLDVVLNNSGKHTGKTRISKKGNVHIRCGLYMPAMTIIRYNKVLGNFYKRLVEKGKIGKVALIAVARKTLVLMYTLWKNNCMYDPDYIPVAA